ncbi:hypothetical protein HJC23_001579 [Cyclotella cryptica]|uniref:PDZ domain-containing protein n=1 Tax=Cyclotella cryptica TaxID=29204 RepID=A0ABD3NR32_9STRA|eukprot:CCRYP_020077-RA/>CCRYP_020077-RA protein AED:0.19 eAED:0.19 QI:175/1/1/1/1/1/2/701/1238
MTVIKSSGMGSQQQNQHRTSATTAATVINPYLKKKVQGTATAPTSSTSHVRLSVPARDRPKSSSPRNSNAGSNRVSIHAVTPLKTQPAPSNKQAPTRPFCNDVAKASSKPTVVAISPKINNPPNVTPTPKISRQPYKRTDPAHKMKSFTDKNSVTRDPSEKDGHSFKNPSSPNGSIVIQPMNPKTNIQSKTSNPNPAKNLNPTKSKPTSLKSQLKSQIAALQRQKKQLLQQKERERQLAIKEQERKQKEAEMARLQLLKEKEREEQKRLCEERRKEEERLKLEKKMERERAKEEKIIRREVGVCLSQLTRRMEGRVHWEKRKGVNYEIGEVVEFLVREVEKRNRNPVVGGSGSAIVGKNSKFSPQMTFQSTWTPLYGHNFFGPWSQYGQSIPFSTQSLMPPSFPVIIPQQQRPKQPKPLILHENPMDRYSPFIASHHVLEGTVCITKKSLNDSFGVTLRWECRSVLVPRENNEVDDTRGVGGDKMDKAPGENLAIPICQEANTLPPVGVIADGVSSADESNPPVELAAASNKTIELSSNQKQRRKRRRRVSYGVLIVTDVSKAKCLPASEGPHPPALKASDIILAVNGRNVGGLSFSEACKAITTTSVEDKKSGFICCSLKVARMIQLTQGNPSQNPLPDNSSLGNNNAATKANTPPTMSTNTNVANPAPPAPMAMSAVAPISNIPSAPLIPFIVDGDKVSGEFSSREWQTLIRSLSYVHRELSTGMALQPVSISEILVACLKKEEWQKALHQRSIDTLGSKLSHEGKIIECEMKRLAEAHWASQWKLEVDQDANNENKLLFLEPLTDAKRSALRALARPLNGCRCGSMSHEFVNDPKCVLYREVKAFVGTDDTDNKEYLGAARSTFKRSKARNALEAAYIERFDKLRAETQSAKQEAEFVLNMEIKQSSEMKKAVLCPNSLCTIVLSAVASLTEDDADDKEVFSSSAYGATEITNRNTDVDCEDDSDEEEDIPLNLLIQRGSKRETDGTVATSPKRIKRAVADVGTTTTKESPSPYFLAKILRYISKTYGHLFHEPSHIEYAWQQRHRSLVTSPLPREVLFQGNPRRPGNLSFENIQFMLRDDRMARLLNEESSHEGLNDEWIVTYLSSNEVTGLRHEIDVLESMGLIEIKNGGKVSLASTWQSKVPHMMLIEMRDDWGPEKDVHNLHCLNTMIRSLRKYWECVGEDGWRLSVDGANASGDRNLDFENDEYFLRKQIFYENFESFVNEEIGVGDFGC